MRRTRNGRERRLVNPNVKPTVSIDPAGYTLTLRPMPAGRGVPCDVRLRQVLKFLRRTFAFECVRIEPVCDCTGLAHSVQSMGPLHGGRGARGSATAVSSAREAHNLGLIYHAPESRGAAAVRRGNQNSKSSRATYGPHVAPKGQKVLSCSNR